MRDIKFRCYLKPESVINKKLLIYFIKTYCNGISLINRMFDVESINFKRKIISFRAYGLIHNASFEDVYLMRSTCLLDKNNKEAYEGDIVMGHTHKNGIQKCEIQYRRCCAAFCINFINSWGTDITECITWIQGYFFRGFEIIGNIHENPTLFPTAEELRDERIKKSENRQ